MSDTPDGWADRLRENRAEKDRFFAEHRQSPIPPAERDGFDRIVLGGGERSTLGKIQLGSIVEFVLLNAQTPVTLVR